MLIIGNELAQTRELLPLYESLISEYENRESRNLRCPQPRESMRGLLFYSYSAKEKSEMPNKTFFTYEQQIEKLTKEKQLVISDP